MSSSSEHTKKKDTKNQEQTNSSRIPINELLLASASILVLGLLQYILKPLDGLELEVLLASCAMAVVVPLILYFSPPRIEKGEKPISAGVFLLVLAAFLALGLLHYTWEPLAKFSPEVIPMLFVMAVVVINLVCYCASKIVKYIKIAVNADSKKDLRAGIVDVKATLKLRIARNANPDEKVVDNCNKLLDFADERCKEGLTNVGWRAVSQARLLSLYLLGDEDKETRNGALVALSRGAVELDSWRRVAVKSILENPNKSGKLKSKVTVSDLYEANKVLEEYTNDKFDSLDRSAWQLYILGIAALVSLVALAFALPHLSASEPLMLLEDRLLVPVIILVGALGGATGGFFSVLRWFKTKKAIAHEQTMSSWMIAIRPLIGAVFALAVSLFMFSSLLNLGEVSLELLLSICFVAGFSEHFVIDIVNRIVKEDTSAISERSVTEIPEIVNEEAAAEEAPAEEVQAKGR